MSKRTPRKPQSETSSTRDAATAMPAPDAQGASLPKPRARKKTAAHVEATSANSRPTPADGVSSKRPSPTHDEIAIRAYYIALERGFSSDPMADWLLAERELTGAPVTR